MHNIDIRNLEPQLANLRAYWLGWGTEDRRTDGVTLYRSGIAHPRLNAVLRIEETDVLSAVRTARHDLADVPWLWDVSGDTAPGVAEALLSAGAVPAGSMPIMALDLSTLPEAHVAVRPLTLARTDEQTVEDHVIAYSPSMGVPETERGRALASERSRAYPDAAFERYHARIGGDVVGTAEILVKDGVAGLYLVSTGPRWRRRGIATSLSMHVLLRSRELGARVATLQASPDGEPVYRRLGLTEVARTRSFIVDRPNSPS